MAKTWTTAATARTAFADMVEALDDAQLDAPTLCGHWTPRLITAHLVSFVDVPLPKFLANIARRRFDYGAAADSMARTLAERPFAELVGTLRAKAARSSGLPIFPESMTIADTLIHTQDVRRPLGLRGDPDPALVRTVLEFLASHRQAGQITDPRKVAAVSLHATDLDWWHGSGPLVEGTGEAIVMALAGRPVVAELHGEGVAHL
ncbi:MAG: maleylpyruvate isomerase family mycothiol-dependent enzyme [Acidimicrobiia bacterium]|nr:maleylpyruvate isomerase family mycothiol-dependent enzyme [Acidimicrobiia bacterium]